MTPRPGRRLLVHAAAALLAGVVAHAQRPAPARTHLVPKVTPAYAAMRLAEWRTAVRTHVGGQFDTPATSIARWEPDLTRVVVDLAIRVRDQRRARNVIDDDKGDIAKGLVLHTDIAMAERMRETGRAGRHAVLLLDARAVGSVPFSIHWGLGSHLADALASHPAEAPIARAWYRAVAALYQQWADLGQLQHHLTMNGDLLAGDAVLQLYLGTLHQAYADPRVQSFLSRTRTAVPDPRVEVVWNTPIDGAEPELRTAERHLRRAVEIDPALVEARIRLAHVLSGRAKPAEAAPIAREALAAPLSPFLEYYAAMVLGRIETQLGQRAEARTAFARAAARYPNSQATQVALSQLGVLEGRPADGVAAMMQALGPGAVPGIEDPWSQYFRLHEPDAKSLLDALRRLAP